MSEIQDISAQLQERVNEAAANRTALWLRGSGSKDFIGREPRGDILDLSGHNGIINYEPTELVITARAGTTLKEIEETLAAHNQLLPFEPPWFSEGATLGGTIACNLSGPRRPYAGGARDFVLGSRVLNGKGEILHFGGEVMKNVAGYDISRLMAGAMGTLGILLDISLKVLPRPAHEVTLVQEDIDPQVALDRLHALALLPLATSATAYYQGRMYLRLCGGPRAVNAAIERIGGEPMQGAEAHAFWRSLKNQTNEFFGQPQPLWRLAIASDTPPIDSDGHWLYEWGGGQRWLVSDAPADEIRKIAVRAGGHATAWRHHASRDDCFQPLKPGLMAVHQKLKQAFDPHGIFNPGRLYAEL